MLRPYSLLTLSLVLLTLGAKAQKIVYSEVDEDDSRRMRFEVIGKVSGNFLVYKNVRNKSYIAVYNNEMQEVTKEEQDYIPTDRLINVDFFPYSDFTYLIYQYQKKSVVYCNAVKIDGSGKHIGNVIPLDTSHIGFLSDNKIYNAISSEDKSKIMVFKINSKNKERYVLTTLLFDNALTQLKRSRMTIDMEEYKNYLDEFHVDNDGDLVFTKYTRNNNETISGTSLMLKAAQADTLAIVDAQPDKIFLDELHIKVDNVNKRYFLTSFYYPKKRGDIEGFYFYVWDKATHQSLLQNAVPLSEALRKEAKGSANVKSAFDDYFIRNIIIKRDGGFIINTESYYTTSRGAQWNRFNYLYGYPYSTYDYYSLYSPYSTWYWRRDPFYSSRNNVRYNADNITILSFDKTGKMEWSNVIHKEQFDDESEDRISYQTVNTGGQIHYVFNVDEKRALLLNDFTLSPDGQIQHNPTLKNLDRGYEFMPKFGKQVSSYQLIVPCYYRNYICFAKVEFNQ